MRVVDLEVLSADADTSRLLGQFLTIFGGISFMLSVPFVLLFGESFAGQQGWTAEHFFLANTIAAAGVIAVLTWDAAFPDKRDLLVLGALPVRARTIFAAKTMALCAAPAVGVIALNSCTGVIWP